MIWDIQIELKSFLSLTNKYDFYSENFSKLLICEQPPKQPETWGDSSLSNQTPD